MIRKVVARASEGDLVARVVTALFDMTVYAFLIIIGLLISDVFQATKSLLALGVTLVAGTVFAILLYDGGHPDLAGAIVFVLAIIFVDYFVDNKMAKSVKDFMAKLGK